MTEDLLIGGSVVGGVVVLLKALQSFMKKPPHVDRLLGELYPLEWEQKTSTIVQTCLVSNAAVQNEILRQLAEGQAKIGEGIIRLVALQEQLALKILGTPPPQG